MAELADAPVLGAGSSECGFKSHSPHHNIHFCPPGKGGFLINETALGNRATGDYQRMRTRSIFSNIDLTQGSISKGILKFALPLMLGNVMQQLYHIVDTLVVGRYIGNHALAAVGSAYTLTVLITSVISGPCMGSGTWIAMQYGQKDDFNMKCSCFQSFVGIAAVTAGIHLLVSCTIGPIAAFMQIPSEVRDDFLQYSGFLFWGIPAVFLYNYFANLLRATGNASIPLCLSSSQQFPIFFLT